MAQPKAGFERILFPTDFTRPSENAAKHALMLAKRDNAALYVVHVVNINDDIAAFFVSSGLEDLISNAEKKLRIFCSKHLKGYKNIKTEVLAGVPHREILRFSKANKNDVVVVGSYGKGSVDRFLMGSTTEKIIRKSACPVLVIPPKE